MALGEHLRIQVGGRYDHAVDCGDHTVLHLAMATDSGRPGVKRSLLLDFTRGAERVEVLRHRERTYPAKVVVSRAFSKLGDSAAWAMFPSPVHFVTWCLTGQAPTAEGAFPRPAFPAEGVPAEPPRPTRAAPSTRQAPAKARKATRAAAKPAARAAAKKAPRATPAKKAKKAMKGTARPKKVAARPAPRKKPGKAGKIAARPKKAKRSR